MATITALGIGSGLDLTGLLDQLEAAERQKLVPIAQQKQSYQSKISAYGVLQNALNQFQTAADKLKDGQLFSAVKSSVTGSSVTAASSSDAAAGVYQVNVSQLATHYSVATAGVADKSAELAEGATTLRFAFGDAGLFDGEGEPLEGSVGVEIAAGSSLEDIRDAINAAGIGVTASIVNDGSEVGEDGQGPWRLALAASETGTEAAFSVDFGGLDGGDSSSGLKLDLGDEESGRPSTEVEAQNAQLTVNGIVINSQGNQVEGAIEGVTLALAEEGASTLRIEQDNETMTEAVKGFVSAYNTLQSTISRLTSYNAESGAAGDLLGDAALRNVQSQLRREMGDIMGGIQVGDTLERPITLQLKGDLKIDEEKLEALVNSNPGALADFFAGATGDKGFASKLSDALELMTRDGGVVDNAKKGLQTSIASLDTRFTRMEQSIDATIARYRSQFAQLDSMIASMNSTSAYLTQQFDMMNAQLGNGRR